MTISKELLDELLSGVERPEGLLGDKGLMKELKVRLMERMLGAELTEHLDYEPHGAPASQQANRRNGATRKVLKSNDGAVPIDIPRDRDGSFEPELIQKGQTRIDGIDDKIIGLYAAGLSTRDIRAHLEEVYGLRVSADLISRVTDAVLAEVSDWQNRALEPMYPIVFLDALRVKIRDAESRQVKNKAVYVALGVISEGEREVLGLWIAANEGAKFWLSIMNNLRNRGVEDILIAVVDGLKGFAAYSTIPDLEGVTSEEWSGANLARKRKGQEQFERDLPAIRRAIASIRKINGDAAALVGLTPKRLTADRVGSFVTVETPSPGTLKSTGIATLEALNFKIVGDPNASEIWRLVRHHLHMHKVIFLHFDEAQDFILNQSGRESNSVINTIKSLTQCKKWLVSVILSGNTVLADILDSDFQLGRRVPPVFFEDLVPETDLSDVEHILSQYLSSAGLEFEAPADMDDFLARLIFSASCQLGLVFEFILEAIQRAFDAQRLQLRGHDFRGVY